MAQREPPLSGIRILVVEDDVLIALDIADTLTRSGGHVLGPAANVREAHHLIDGHFFDVAVLDFRLGDETSAPIADRLLARSSPFFFHCGSSEDVKRLYPLVRVLPKPGRYGQLVDAIAALHSPRRWPA